ncbi:hypothetical protein KGF54_001727 [Candida jiufengensis]|uniref:uncharacterized protein n=1 Tax=Candida jiufengensis TaxID=497108 RepID=UPI0022256082|nr:uncharacterized protein KGF54_001727 [Candida jiufengensis]KAI5955166.1 hypothetical protein KGF54_001727 [Candida jiufengensis]
MITSTSTTKSIPSISNILADTGQSNNKNKINNNNNQNNQINNNINHNIHTTTPNINTNHQIYNNHQQLPNHVQNHNQIPNHQQQQQHQHMPLPPPSIEIQQQHHNNQSSHLQQPPPQQQMYHNQQPIHPHTINNNANGSISNVSSSPQIEQSSKDPPRKRSKISRACDACRRKKIKCNAEFSSTLNEVTQICNNCQKNSEECTFSRTPLKRGPSKGFSKDLEDNIQNELHRTNSISSQTTIKDIPQNSVSFPSIKNQSQQQLQSIKLPPLMNYSNKNLSPAIQKINTMESNPSSPQNPQFNNGSNNSNNNNNNSNNNSPPIQGPFWKVPYEMPQSSSSHRSSISSVTSSGQPSRRRRSSSIDSISSTSTTGIRMPTIKNTTSNEFLSDSESEDFYSIKSSNSQRPSIIRNNSQSISPRNSITSLSSLNGRMNKSLLLHSPSSPISTNNTNNISTSKPHLQFLSPHGISPQFSTSPMNLLKADLEVYEKVFAPSFPIISVDNDTLISIIQTNGIEVPTENLVEIFHMALNDLINFKSTDEFNTISMFFKLQQLHQFSKINKNSSFMYGLTLLLINYALLLKGSFYGCGIAMASSFFNELNILEHVLTSEEKDLRFAKLYLNLDIIDSIVCLKSGVSKFIPSGNLSKFVSMNESKLSQADLYYDLKNLVDMKNETILSSTMTLKTIKSKDIFIIHFYNLVNEKYQLFNIFNQQQQQQSQLTEKLEKLATTILNFANYLSTSTMENKNLLSSILNISITQLFWISKFLKIIIENLPQSDQTQKIFHNLSISFSLLSLNLSNLPICDNVIRSIKQSIIDDNLNFTTLTTSTTPTNNWIQDKIIPMIKLDLMRH